MRKQYHDKLLKEYNDKVIDLDLIQPKDPEPIAEMPPDEYDIEADIARIEAILRSIH